MQVEKFNQGWKKCGVGERVKPKYAWRKKSFGTNITFKVVYVITLRGLMPTI